jgi:hypothetical protein
MFLVAGKLTVSSVGADKKVVHQLVTIDSYAVILGKVKIFHVLFFFFSQNIFD